MKLLNERNQVREVAEQWKSQYGYGSYTGDKRNRDVYKELAALNVETATADEVAEIIGNSSWVAKRHCDECGTDSWDAVQIGEEPGYESATAIVCVACLGKALNLVHNNVVNTRKD